MIKPVGGRRPRVDGQYLAVPRLWIFPPSLNSGKAHVALHASSCSTFTVQMLGIMGANYSPEYAALNPLMAVPTLEIDDVIINDSLEIVRYLRKHYPGQYTTDSQEVRSFVDLVASWDEGLWNYGTLQGASKRLKPGMRAQSARLRLTHSLGLAAGGVSRAAELANEARLYYLRMYRARVAKRRPVEKELLAAYDAKIAAIGRFAGKAAAGPLRDQVWVHCQPSCLGGLFILTTSCLAQAGSNR